MAIRNFCVTALAVFAVMARLSNVAALEGSRPVPEGQRRPYATVRAEMIRLGWKPIKAKHFDYDYYCGKDVCRQYPELLNCSIGHVTCEFGFVRGTSREYRMVVTDGEHPQNWRVVRIIKPGKYDMDAFRGRPGEPYQ